ncbi:MAG: SH3 domain-containing protein [Chloroflexota bacterium]
MPFQLVYYSQQDPQWKNDILGFGDPGDTLGYVGCALTSVAMLLSGHGFTETPKSLNQKLKNINGFAGAGIRWGSVSQLYPQVTVKSIIACADTPAPLAQIDAAIAAGQPAIVMVDSTPAPGLLTHWVVLYARKGDDYLMLDPWPYQTDVTKETLLMPRYSQGNPLQRSIMHVILYESGTADGSVTLPSGETTTTSAPAPAETTPQTPPASAPVSTGLPQARVKADVTWGLNIRTSEDTSSMANVVATVPAGTQLSIVEPGGAAKIGAVNQWIRVRAPNGKEGVAAAWYLEKVEAAAPAPAPATSPESTPAPIETEESTPAPAPASTPASTPSTMPSSAPNTIPKPPKLTVVVSSKAGAGGLKVYQSASASSAVVATEKVGAKLTVVEAASAATPKIGKAGQWLNVKSTTGARGYVKADYVQAK